MRLLCTNVLDTLIALHRVVDHRRGSQSGEGSAGRGLPQRQIEGWSQSVAAARTPGTTARAAAG